MPADRLRDARTQIAAGQFSLTPDTQRAVLKRVDDLIEDVAAAERAMGRLPQPAVADAASRTAHLFYISGHGWRRYLAESAESARAGIEIGLALRDCIAPVLAQLSVAIDTSRTRVVKKADVTYTLTCSACDADAVTFSQTRTGPAAPVQLVVSSLSPVTVFRPIAGPRMHDLLALLDGGDASEVVKYMTVTQPAGCDACCPTCGGTYCKEHTAIEAQWSGSWHEATYATCPLGHEREIE